MKKVDERLWREELLKQATLITNGKGYMKTYDLNNGLILKRIKSIDNLENVVQYNNYDDFIRELTVKLRLSKSIDVPELVLPNTIFFDKDGRLEAYCVPKIEEKTLDDVLSSVTSLQFYDKVFTLLTDSVKRINSEGIILPDLANTSNILLNPKNNRVHFIDYDGMQVKDCKTFNIAGLLEQNKNPMLSSDKYTNNDLFNINLDKLSLLVIFIYYTTGKNIMSDLDPSLTLMQLMNECLKNEGCLTPNVSMFLDFFEEIGIKDTEISELVQRVFDPSINNLYPNNAIKKLTKTHNLVTLPYGKRRFEQK